MSGIILKRHLEKNLRKFFKSTKNIILDKPTIDGYKLHSNSMQQFVDRTNSNRSLYINFFCTYVIELLLNGCIDVDVIFLHVQGDSRMV